MKANPAVRSTFTMSGNGQFMGSNQAFLIAFLKEPSQRPPIAQVAGQLMGAIGNAIPGTVAFLQPNPALEISTGATANAQGQFAYALSGIDANEVYDTAAKMMAKMHEYPGFLFVNSDLYNHTPNLRGPGPALHQERRRPAYGSSQRGHELASGHRPASSQSHQSIH